MSNVKTVKNVAKNSNKSNKAPNDGAPVAETQVSPVVAPVAKVAPAVEAPAKVSGAFDELRGRIDSRTHAIHVVLIRAYKAGAPIKTKDIVAQARELLTANHPSYEKLERTAPSHFNTMKTRKLLERVDGAWRLTEEGAKLANVFVDATETTNKKKNKKSK